MEAIGVALVGIFAMIGIGISSHGGPDYPKEHVLLKQKQANVIAEHLSGHISDEFAPGKTILKLVHNNTPLSSELEMSLRKKGYAVVSNDKIKVEPRVTYAIDRLSENQLVVNLDVGNNFDLTGTYKVEDDGVIPVEPVTIKTDDQR